MAGNGCFPIDTGCLGVESQDGTGHENRFSRLSLFSPLSQFVEFN